MNGVRQWLALTFAAVSVQVAAAPPQGPFDYIAGWKGQLFPSYIIATATMEDDDDKPDEKKPDEEAKEADDTDDNDAKDDGDEAMMDRPAVNILGDPKSKSLLGVIVVAPEDDTPIAVEIEAPGVLETSRWTGVLAEKGAEYTIYPALKFNFRALIANTQSIPLAVTYRVALGDDEPIEHTVNVTLRSINDCPVRVVYGKDDAEDVSFMFAAYVNEQHPYVDKVLREALDRGVVNAFTGYQTGQVDMVIRQVYAVWDALSRRDVRYSNITASAAANQMVQSQHVRLIDQSINNAQANCVDGSVLMASLLRKIDIHPALVLVPGHCYLVFALDREGNRLAGLETTMIGDKEINFPPDEESDKIVGPKFARQHSWLTFRGAMATGNKNLGEDIKKFGKDDSSAYQLISIAKARQKGILPIAFDSSERFSVPKSKSR